MAFKSLLYGLVAGNSEEPAGAVADCGAPGDAEIFIRYVRDYAYRRSDGPIAILEAGCGRPSGAIGVERLRAAHFDVRVTGIDQDDPLTRQVSAARRDLNSVTLGDVRTVPLLPRSFDIVHCAGLIERIEHVELVLDRLVAALKPGGILLLRMADRDSAAGLVERCAAAMPRPLRQRAWRRLRPGQPGPYPAVYERVVSRQGIQAYALMRGLVIAERQAMAGAVAARGALGRILVAVRWLAAAVSRGRYAGDHDELLFVLRKPEDRFARVL